MTRSAISVTGISPASNIAVAALSVVSGAHVGRLPYEPAVKGDADVANSLEASSVGQSVIGVDKAHRRGDCQ